MKFKMSDERICALIQETRRVDGFINATVWCTKYGRMFGHFAERQGTKYMASAVSKRIGRPSMDVRRGVVSYVHPMLFLELVRWLDPSLYLELLAPSVLAISPQPSRTGGKGR